MGVCETARPARARTEPAASQTLAMVVHAAGPVTETHATVSSTQHLWPKLRLHHPSSRQGCSGRSPTSISWSDLRVVT